MSLVLTFIYMRSFSVKIIPAFTYKILVLYLFHSLSVISLSMFYSLCFEITLALAGGSVGWSVVPYTKCLRVQFPVRAHT